MSFYKNVKIIIWKIYNFSIFLRQLSKSGEIAYLTYKENNSLLQSVNQMTTQNLLQDSPHVIFISSKVPCCYVI